MIGSLCSLKIFQVARIASGSQTFEDSARMALHASGDSVRAGKWEGGLRSVIERGPVPIDGGMAKLAILWEARGGMVRVSGALIVLEVTR